MIPFLERLRQRETLDCVVEISNRFEALGAHVRFAEGVVIHPGDEVLVHGAPVAIPYGESRSFPRRATITRAGMLRRGWTRLRGEFEVLDLCEVSFSERTMS